MQMQKGPEQVTGNASLFELLSRLELEWGDPAVRKSVWTRLSEIAKHIGSHEEKAVVVNWASAAARCSRPPAIDTPPLDL